MDYQELVTKLRTESLYKDKATLEIMDLCMDAAQTLESLQSELEKVKAERDALIKRTAGDCWSCIRRYECNSRKGPHSRCWEFDPWLLKEETANEVQ